MTKHRSVVTGWDPDHVNPDDSTGRPKGVQTAPDMRIATTYDILAEGIFAKYGVPTITGSPTDTATISPFQAAIASSLGGFYVITVDANEQLTINLSNVGAVKIYAQQQDYETDNTKVDSNVVIGVVYGATAIPAGSILLFTTTITSQTSTSGLTFTPAFKYTGPASGVIRVPKQSDLANLAVTPTAGLRALVLTNGGGGTVGEYFYTGSAWQQSSVANAKLDSFLTNSVDNDGTLKPASVKASDLDFTTLMLGYAEKTSISSTTNTGPTDIGLSVTVTIPAGVSSVVVQAFCPVLYCTTLNVAAHLSLWKGNVGTGTQIQDSRGYQSGSSGTGSPSPMRKIDVVAGNTYTFKVGLHAESASTARAEGSAAAPTILIVRAV